jgi:hypothetical protein
MAEFLERVSRALCQNAGHDPGGKQRLNSGEEENWTFFVDAARAAIEAMREPTHTMVEAALEDILVADASAVWRTMITAALSPTSHA